MSIIRTAILSVVLAFGAGAGLAQNFLKGLVAAEAGDYATALKEWRPLAEQGDVHAQGNIGNIYAGDGALQDYPEAAKWWRMAAEQGLVGAQHNLGLLYSKGDGVLQDYAEALKWYQLAAKQADVGAQSSLANMYYYGKGVLQNNIRAHVWYNIASANGHKKTAKWRDETAAKMTSADISEAQKMAKECMDSNYQNCGW